MSSGDAAKDAFVVAVAAVIVRDDRAEPQVLAMRRAATKDAGAGIWETCSGRLEAGEQPIDALAREVVEETGLEVRIAAQPVDAYTMRRGERPMVVLVYRADWVAGEVRRSDEHDAHAWWTRAELESSPMPPRLIEAVVRALASGPQPTS